MCIVNLFFLPPDVLTVYFSFEFLLRFVAGNTTLHRLSTTSNYTPHRIAVQTRRAIEPAVATGLDAIVLSREAIETAIESTGRCI